jgi:uncharacterized protein
MSPNPPRPRSEPVPPDPAAEFSRRWPSAPPPEAPVAGEADAAERAALARRYGALSVERLAFTAEAAPWRGGLRVSGEARARVTQSCVVTLEPVEAELSERFERRFLPEDRLTGLDPADLDAPEPLPAALDIGEMAAEAVALGLDPYPRRPGVVFGGRAEGPEGPEAPEAGRESPFARLAALKRGGG